MVVHLRSAHPQLRIEPAPLVFAATKLAELSNRHRKRNGGSGRSQRGHRHYAFNSGDG